MDLEKYLPEAANLPKEIREAMKQVFVSTYKDRRKVSGKKAMHSAKAAALAVAHKMMSRNIVDRGNKNA